MHIGSKTTLATRAGASIAAALLAGSAHAAVFITSFAGAPDPGPRMGETRIITFNSGTLPTGVTITGDYGIVTGSKTNFYGAPAGDLTPYLTVPKAKQPGSATMKFANFLYNNDVNHFSFYWGSIDAFNSIQLLNRKGGVIGTVSGSSFPPAAGSLKLGSQNRRVEFTLTGADRQLGGIKLNSKSFALESDTYAFAAVPEPSAWALMISGFAGVGMTLRARRARRTLAA